MGRSEESLLHEEPFRGFKSKSLEQKIQELADREEIRELIARYALRVGQGASPANLFTDDGALIVRNPGRPVQETRGRAELEKRLAGMERGWCLPMVHNLIIRIDGDEASGMCSIEVRMAEKGQSLIASGYYRDQLRRENGSWKFVVRDMTSFHLVPHSRGWAEEPHKAQPA